MAAKNKARGNAAEYYIKDQLEQDGFKVDRGWGSDGRAMGEHEEVDLRIHHIPSNQKVQVKRRKQVASYIIPSEHVDVQMLYVDRAKGVQRQVLAVVTLDRYMELLSKESKLEKVMDHERSRYQGWAGSVSSELAKLEGMYSDEEVIEERD